MSTSTGRLARRARALAATLLGFALLVVGPVADAAVSCVQQYSYRLPATTTYWVRVQDGFRDEYDVRYPVYDEQYYVSMRDGFVEYLVQRPIRQHQYQVQFRNSRTEYDISYPTRHTEYEYQPFLYTDYHWRWLTHITHTNFYRNGTTTSCTKAWNQGGGCGHHGKGWTGHTDTPHYATGTTQTNTKPHPTATLTGQTAVYGSYTWSATPPPGAKLTGQQRTATTWSRPQWSSWPWGREGIDFRWGGNTRQIRTTWSTSSYWLRSLPSGIRNVDYRVLSERDVIVGWTAGTWSSTWPSGTYGVDYRVADTRGTYWWTSPVWVTDKPAGIEGHHYKVQDVRQVWLGWSGIHTRSTLPAGTNGVHYLLVAHRQYPVYRVVASDTPPANPADLVRTDTVTTDHVGPAPLPEDAVNVTPIPLPDDCQVVRPT